MSGVLVVVHECRCDGDLEHAAHVTAIVEFAGQRVELSCVDLNHPRGVHDDVKVREAAPVCGGCGLSLPR